MATLLQRQAHHAAMHELLTSPERLAAIHQDTEVPPIIQDWLAELQRLRGLPFDYLVPSPEFLPVESIRFFQLDPNWITALLEGAFSIGDATAGDVAHNQVMRAKVQSLAPGEVVSGFLLRSEVVRGWPNLGVIVYDGAGQVMANLTEPMHLADTVVLVMVSGPAALASVAIHEHPEGLHFGVNMPATTGGKWTKSLRYLSVPDGAPAGTAPGDEMIGGPEVDVPFRPGGKRVIAAGQLASSLATALTTAQAGAPKFTSAEFALEMIEGVQSVIFKQA